MMNGLRALLVSLKEDSDEQLKQKAAYCFLSIYCGNIIKRQAYNPSIPYLFILENLNEDLVDFKFHLILRDNPGEYIEFTTEDELNAFIKGRFPTDNTDDKYEILDEWIHDELNSGAFIFFGKRMYSNAPS